MGKVGSECWQDRWWEVVRFWMDSVFSVERMGFAKTVNAAIRRIRLQGLGSEQRAR